MKRSLFLVLVAACAGDKPPRTEVAIAPQPSPSASAPEITISPDDAGTPDDEDLFDAMMNADPRPNNQSAEEDALMIQMMNNGKPPQHGVPVIHVSNDTSEAAGDRMVIRRVIRQNAASMRACYAKGLAIKPDLAGRVVVRFRIDSSGNVTSAESTTATTLPSAPVVACVVDAIKPLVFPQRRGGSLIVNYPIVFAP